MITYKYSFKGMMVIFYIDRPIAVIDEDGKIVMKSPIYSTSIIEYWIENLNMHMYWLN